MCEKLAGLAPRRKAAGRTQAELAAAIRVSRATVAVWETGRAWPSSQLLPDIAHALGCTIAELYEEPPDQDITIIPRKEAVVHAG